MRQIRFHCILHLVGFICLLPFTLGSTPVSANTLSFSSNDDIVVTGRQAKNLAKEYINDVKMPEYGGQYAVWDSPICIAMIDWEPQHGIRIKRKIEEIVENIGHKNASEKCTPNLGIVLTDDPLESLEKLKNSNPRQYNLFSREQRHIAEAGDQAVTILLGADLRSQDGRDRPSYTLAGLPGITSINGKVTSVSHLIMRGSDVGSSLIGLSRKTDFVVGIVFVDINAIHGSTFEGLASYIALRALSGIPHSGIPSAGNTVLTLFQDLDSERNPPRFLSEWDTAFLTGLYEARRAERSNRQRHEIIKTMSKKLASK